MSKSHCGIYGAVKLLREYCSKCRGFSFINNGKLICCGRRSLEENKRFKVISSPLGKRLRPSVSAQQRILKIQDNKCLYCEKEFGVAYQRNRKILLTRLHFDHLIPFSYSKTNPDFNFVAACNICNALKSNLFFDTVQEVFHYVEYQRRKKGIKYLDELPTLSTETS